MGWEGWLTLVTVFVMFIALAREWAATDVILWGALGVLVLAGTITGSELLPNPAEAVSGMGNSGLVTVGLLFVVVEGLMRTGATEWMVEPLLKIQKTRFGVKLPLLASVAAVSPFLNNTAVVAMFLPIVQDLCKKTGTPPSKLFLPMCHATTLGGVCTLMGTSTNLVVDGMMRRADVPGLRVFELGWVGVPVTVAGVFYLFWASKYLLPDRRSAVSLAGDPREYSVEMQVDSQGPLVGKTIEEAGLRHLPGLFLVEIQRKLEIIAAVTSHERLEEGDRLIFVGIVDSVVDLRKVRGLTTAEDVRFQLDNRPDRCLIEAVVSPACPLIEQSIREADFRSVYDAAVLAVARSGERVKSKIGDIVLQPGDTLLLETDPDFVTRHRYSRHFFLVSRVENSQLPRRHRGSVALAILAGLIGCVATGKVDLLPAAFLAAFLMLIFRCCTSAEGRQAVDWGVLLVIGAALGIADAMESSGAAEHVSNHIIGLAGGSPWATLAAIYFTSLLATELITNNAAAALMVPVALSTARFLEVNPVPYMVAVMISASCGFATPFGYQTNLMVAGPGGYRFSDFVRFGVPLDVLVMVIAVILIPLIWPF